MSDIASKLVRINDTRKALRQTLLDKNVDIPAGTPFAEYPAIVRETLPASVTVYKRNSEWLPLQEAAPNQINVLYRINVEKTYVALSVSGTAYTVDWGDGIIQSYADGLIAQHIYSYDDIDAGTETEGYRQVVIQVTANTGGVITGANLGHRHTLVGSISGYALEVDCNLPACNSLTFTVPTTGVVHHFCRKITVRQIGVLTNLDNLCSGFRNLMYLDLPSNFFTHATTMIEAFRNCHNLRELVFPPNSLANVTTMQSAFRFCLCLQELVFPTGSLVSVTNLESTFQAAIRLRNVVFPAGSLTQVTTLAMTFNGCSELREVIFPENSLTRVTTTNTCFNSCVMLKTVYFPSGSLALTTDMSSMFLSCLELQNLTLPPLPSVTTMRFMLSSAQSLTDVVLTGPFNALTIAQTAISGRCIKNITFTHSLPAVTDARTMFNLCDNLETITFQAGSFSNVNLTTSMFATAPKLKRIVNLGVRVSFSVANCNLSAAALNEIYTALPIVTGQTITVTGNPGTTGHNISIATAKGWTVVQS